MVHGLSRLNTVWPALVTALALLVGGPSFATEASPYTGLQGREIKALSAEEIKGLTAGEGMAQSLAAELNGYPGPRHVLELARELKLSEAQRASAADLEVEMKRAAVTLGNEVVALEAELERLFRAGQADAGAIDRLSAEIGAKRGALRAVHLRAHLEMAAALSPEQRSRYMHLRGYGDGNASGGHPRRHQHH
jgi:Spy/CpxP family protein refolding chaperone